MLLITGGAEGGALPLSPALVWEPLRGEAGDPRFGTASSPPTGQGGAVAEVGGAASAVGAGRGWGIWIDPADYLELVVPRQILNHPAADAASSSPLRAAPQERLRPSRGRLASAAASSGKFLRNKKLEPRVAGSGRPGTHDSSTS